MAPPQRVQTRSGGACFINSLRSMFRIIRAWKQPVVFSLDWINPFPAFHRILKKQIENIFFCSPFRDQLQPGLPELVFGTFPSGLAWI